MVLHTARMLECISIAMWTWIFAGDYLDRKCTTGYLFQFASEVYWRSDKQTVVALSTSKADHVA